MIRAGSTPCITRCATRCASVSVLPVPAPATIRSGPDFTPLLSGRGSPWVTALRCGPLSFSRCDVVDMFGARIYGSAPLPVTDWSHKCAAQRKLMTVGVEHFDLADVELPYI